MPNYNKVMLMGHLTRDPEIRYAPQGKAACKIGLAVNNIYKSATGEAKEDVVFADITFWGKTAETVVQYMRKGRACFVEGRLKLDQWQDKATGAQRSKLTVTGDTVQFLGGKDGAEQSAPQPSAPKPTQPTDDQGQFGGDEPPF